MALPTSATWNLADFNSTTMSLMLGLGPADLSLNPAAAPYFTYTDRTALVTVQSADGAAAYADFNVAVPADYTIDFLVRFPALPHDVADISEHHAGIQLANDAGRGIAIYFSQTGMAFSRIDDFGSVSAIPDSTTFTEEIATYFHRVRVAVNGGLGRAYIFIGQESDPFPPLRFYLPVEPTPPGVADRFRIVARGTATQPTQIEFRALQLAGSLVLPNLPPIANAGADRVITAGNAARLDGRASYDPEGAPLSYLWRAIDAPYGSVFAYDGSNGSTTDDGDSDAVTNMLDVPTGSLPDWVQRDDVLVIAGSRYVIAGADNLLGVIQITTDALPDDLVGRPFRVIRQSLLTGATTETPVAVPDIAGIYRFELVVNDGEIDSEPGVALVNVVGARAPLGVEPAVEVLWEALGDEWRLVANREIFTEFWRGTTQILGARLLEVWQHHYNMNIRDTQRTFQRKWVPFRTLIAETAPDTATLSPRYGKLEGTYDYALGDPAVTGTDVIVTLPGIDGDATTITVTLSADDLTTVLADLNAGLAGAEITAYSVTDDRGRIFVGLRSYTRGFQISIASSAAAVLGLPTGQYNYLSGVRGARVTEDTYRVDTGTDLREHGVRQGDLLVLNGGQAFRIERVLDDPRDPGPYQRLLLSDPLPFDATTSWEIPSIMVSEEVDYERSGSYPGDLLKVESFDPRTNTFRDHNNYVVAQSGLTVGARLDGVFAALYDPTYELRVLGVKRRKGVELPLDVVSIPRLQDLIPKNQDPTLWQENIDYILEPYYRDDLEAPIPQLQFRDSVFVEPDLEPPDIFWAELVIFDNAQNIEDLFGRLTGFLREDAAGFGNQFSYLSGVSGLMYAMQRGPTPYAMRVGAQILFGQPFAEVAGYVTEIRNDYSPEYGRILIQDDDGNVPTASEIVRSYIYRKDPLDLTDTTGLEVNPATGAPYAVGDHIDQFAPIGAGVRISDYKNDPKWFVPFVSSGLITELEKFFYHLVRFNLDLVSLSNITLIYQLIYRIKPTYTHPILLGAKNLVDDIDVVDTFNAAVTLHLYDSTCGMGRAFMYDDYRGDGTVWSGFDDGTSYYDGHVDCPQDYIVFCFSLAWGGGVITYDSVFFLDTDVTDVDGTLGAPGSTFTPTYDMTLPAGTYGVCAVIDAGNQVLP